MTLLVKENVLIKALINGVFFVLPATSERELNIAIVRLADAEGFLCNDEDQSDDVLIPSQVNTVVASIAIIKYGSAPALLNHLKDMTSDDVIP